MSYHHSTILPLGALGWPMAEMASYGMTDSDAIIPNKPLCGNAKAIQGALKDQGYYKGSVDGILGSGSVSAIKAFSLANGLGSKSWPDPAFCAKLREKQNLALNAEYEKRNPPPPPEVGPGGGGDIIPAPSGGQPAQPGGQQVSPAAPPPAAADNTMLYVAGGVGVLLLAAGVYFATRLPMSLLALMSRDDLEGITSGAEIDPKRAGCGSVGQVQLALKQQGYYDGPLTGAFNDEMGSAMQEFLADQGMSASVSNEEFCQALRTAQMELSSKARSEINSRILGVNPILLLLGAAAVVVGAIKLRGGMRPNGRRRMPSARTRVFQFIRRVDAKKKKDVKRASAEQRGMAVKLAKMGVRSSSEKKRNGRDIFFKIRSGPLGKKGVKVTRAMKSIQRKHFG